MASKHDYLLLLLLIILICYVVYWVGYGNYKYDVFQASWFDIGFESLTFYYHLVYTNAIGGLQFVSFAEHIDPFELLLLPFFALYKSPATLLALQDIALAAAAIVVYCIGKDVIKNKQIGFALAIAFLISPGIRGITIYDFHPEGFIPLFYLLCFYFYMRRKNVMAIISYALLMSIIETVVVVGATLLVGLLIYEFIESKDKNKEERNSRLRVIFACLLITIAFAAFYTLSINSLQSSYSNGQYSTMPIYFKIANFYGSQLKAAFSPPRLGNSIAFSNYVLLAVVGIIILVFGFGTYSLKVPITLLVLISPWLFEVIILHNWIFAALYNEYYAYAIGGAVVAGVLGIMAASGKKSHAKPKAFRILLIAVMIAGYTLLLTPISNLNNPALWIGKPSTNLTDLNSALSILNKNSTIMAQDTISAHMYQFKNVELTPDIKLYAFTDNGFIPTNAPFYWFKPQYIIFDKNLPDYYTMNEPAFNVYTYMGNNYTIYYSYNGIEIYKENNLTSNYT